MPTGALLVDKPAGPTSHDVVARVRKLARERRCGHTGTLDPFATGLMILLLGRATRLARFLSERRKSYLASVRFGFATETYDCTGSPLGPESDRCPPRDELERALEGFVGSQEQHPPPYSAKRVQGERAYRLARRGIAVAPEPVRVEIEALCLVDYRPPVAQLLTTVSSGTYIRSLAHDLGRSLGVGAHLVALRRTRVGSFSVEQALDLEALAELAAAGRLEEAVLSPLEALRDLESVTLDAETARGVAHGRSVSWPGASAGTSASSRALRLLGPDGGLLAVGEPIASEDGTVLLRPAMVWAQPESRSP